MSEEDTEVVEETFADGIPDDVDLFAPEEAEPAEEEEAPPETTPAPPPAVEAKPPDEDAPPEDKPPDKAEETPTAATPPEILKMQQDIQKRDRELGERERNYRDADRWRRQSEEYERWQKEFRENPVKAVERMGGDAAQLVSHQLGLADPQKPEEAALERIAKLEQTLAERDKAAQQAQQQARMEEAQTNILNRYEAFTKNAEQTHPHLSSFRQSSGVMYNKAQEYAQATGRWLPDDEAARQAEVQLAAEVKEVLEIAKKMPQYQDWFATPTNGDSRAAASPATTRQPPQGKTLSTKDTATPPPAVKEKDLVGASDEEVLAAGLAAYSKTAADSS